MENLKVPPSQIFLKLLLFNCANVMAYWVFFFSLIEMVLKTQLAVQILQGLQKRMSDPEI